MLKCSIVEQRARSIREREVKNKEYQRLQQISYQCYKELLEKYIPEEKHYEVGNAIFDFETTVFDADYILVKEAYKQGLKDAFELRKYMN